MRSYAQLFMVIYIALYAQAASGADVSHGRDLAERWCSACHVTVPSQRQTTEAPPFATIAKNGMDASRLTFLLMEPHPKMPSMALTRAEAADLAAYIKSLAN